VQLSKSAVDGDVIYQGHVYPRTYGAGCATHDRFLPPICADNSGTTLPDTPGFCRDKWCFVNRDLCTRPSLKKSSYFTFSDRLYFDYSTCTEDDKGSESSSWNKYKATVAAASNASTWKDPEFLAATLYDTIFTAARGAHECIIQNKWHDGRPSDTGSAASDLKACIAKAATEELTGFVSFKSDKNEKKTDVAVANYRHEHATNTTTIVNTGTVAAEDTQVRICGKPQQGAINDWGSIGSTCSTPVLAPEVHQLSALNDTTVILRWKHDGKHSAQEGDSKLSLLKGFAIILQWNESTTTSSSSSTTPFSSPSSSPSSSYTSPGTSGTAEPPQQAGQEGARQQSEQPQTRTQTLKSLEIKRDIGTLNNGYTFLFTVADNELTNSFNGNGGNGGSGGNGDDGGDGGNGDDWGLVGEEVRGIPRVGLTAGSAVSKGAASLAVQPDRAKARVYGGNVYIKQGVLFDVRVLAVYEQGVRSPPSPPRSTCVANLTESNTCNARSDQYNSRGQPGVDSAGWGNEQCPEGAICSGRTWRSMVAQPGTS
jgi:hypothetical protein